MELERRQSAYCGIGEQPPFEWLYIAGYGRSGSTLLDTLLGAVETSFSAGELTHLYDDLTSGRACACGERLDICPVWANILESVSSDVPDLTWQQASTITRQTEALGRRHAKPALMADYQRLWLSTMRAIRNQTGAALVVDSSKSQAFAARRLDLLRTLDLSEFGVIHLTRDPRAVGWSVRSGGNAIAARRRLKWLSVARTVATWTVANLVANHGSRRGPSLHVRYEDLVANPRDELSRIGEFLGVSVEDVAAQVADGRAIDAGHGVHGNRVRTRGPIRLRPDRRWEDEGSTYVRLLFSLTWPLSRRYGYSVLTRPNDSARHASQR